MKNTTYTRAAILLAGMALFGTATIDWTPSRALAADKPAATAPAAMAPAAAPAPAPDAPPAPSTRPPQIGAAGRPAVMAYRMQNYVSPELTIGDGYVDGGHGMKIHADSHVTSSREVLTVDRTRDTELQKQIAYARSEELKKLNPLDRATNLARYVARLYTPPQGRKHLEEMCGVLETTHRNHEVLIGDVPKITKGAGVCRHRSLTYKILAEEAGLKVSLVRGRYGKSADKAGYHAWNELFLEDGKVLIVDTTNPPPGFQFPDRKSPLAARYFKGDRQPQYPPEAAKPMGEAKPMATPAAAKS
ncbi:MAG: transglutaminase domain-containing protein [Planctomycetia bacterium]|nr:transglutaminase domain-containing protein [Planctomycetia bacterium]